MTVSTQTSLTDMSKMFLLRIIFFHERATVWFNIIHNVCIAILIKLFQLSSSQNTSEPNESIHLPLDICVNDIRQVRLRAVFGRILNYSTRRYVLVHVRISNWNKNLTISAHVLWYVMPLHWKTKTQTKTIKDMLKNYKFFNWQSVHQGLVNTLIRIQQDRLTFSCGVFLQSIHKKSWW